MAAALREALARELIVVGGTAQEYHTAAAYHETDLDLVGVPQPRDPRKLTDLGFTKRGRHWFHEAARVAVEFPESVLAGDEDRVIHKRIAGGMVAIIGVDDLYLDRLRQATISESDETIEFRSALAVAAAKFDRIDWRYVERRIRETVKSEPLVGVRMRRADRTVRRRVRNASG